MTINHHRQRKLSEVIPVDLHLLQRLAEVLNLAFLRIVYENVLGAVGAVRCVQVAYKRALGVVEVPPSANECERASCPTSSFRGSVIIKKLA